MISESNDALSKPRNRLNAVYLLTLGRNGDKCVIRTPLVDFTAAS